MTDYIERDYRLAIGVESCRTYLERHPQATTTELFSWIESTASSTYCGWTDADIDDLGIKGTADLTPKQRQEVMELFDSRFDASLGVSNEDLREALVNVTGLDESDDETDESDDETDESDDAQ